MARRRGYIYFILLLTALGLWAQPEPLPWWNSYNAPGTFLLDSSITSISFDNETSSYVQVTGEYILSKFLLQGTVPLDLGLAVTGVTGVEFPAAATFSGVGSGVGLHFGFRGFGGKFESILEKLDIYSHLGVGYTFVHDNSANVEDWTGFKDMPITGYGRLGFSYYLSDSFALTAENTNWGSDSTISIGARLRWGELPDLGTRPVYSEKNAPLPVSVPEAAQPSADEPSNTVIIQEPLSEGEAEFYLEVFRQLYWSIFSHGGLQIDDYNYIEGEGTVFMITLYDEETQSYEDIMIQKALLKRNRDHSVWSYTLNIDDGDILEFKAGLDTQDLLLELTVHDATVVSTYVPDYPMEWNPGIIIEQGDFSQYSRGSREIHVPSGDFVCEELYYDAGEFSYTWYVSKDVPGYVVSFFVEKNGLKYIQGDLSEINLRNSSILGD